MRSYDRIPNPGDCSSKQKRVKGIHIQREDTNTIERPLDLFILTTYGVHA